MEKFLNALAFASFGAKFKSISGKGPQVLKIGGQLYHNTYALHPNEDEIVKFGQLYVIENDEANNIRYEQNTQFSKDLLNKLDNILRAENPYAKAYKMMHEVEIDEIKKAESNNNSIK